MAAPVPPAWVVRERFFWGCGSRTKVREKRLQPFKPQYTLDKSRRMRSIADNTGADDAN